MVGHQARHVSGGGAMGGNCYVPVFSFNFLRMGLPALPPGQRWRQSTLIVICRALLLAAVLGGLLIAHHGCATLLLWAAATKCKRGGTTINIRILGTPAALANFALIGFTIGVQQPVCPSR